MGDTSYFIGTTTGGTTNSIAKGYLVTPDGQMFPVQSGGWGRGYLEPGNYEFRKVQDVTEDNTPMRPEGAKRKGWKKIQIAAVGEQNAGDGGLLIKDSRYKDDPRSVIFAHFDGPSKKNPSPYNLDGTEGCIGYQDIAAQNAIVNAAQSGNNKLKVNYDAASQAEAEATAKRISEQIKRGEKPTLPGPAEPAKTQKGAQVLDGERSVVLGQQQLIAAKKGSPLDNGALVAQGSETVFLGKSQAPFATYTHLTTDGSELASGGVPTVKIG